MAMQQDPAPIPSILGYSNEAYRNLTLLVAAQMKRGEKDIVSPHLYNPFAVDEEFDKSKFKNPDRDEILESLGRKYRHNLTSLKAFVDVMKYKTSSEGVSICPISTTAKIWTMLFNGPRNVSNLLQMAQDVGLLFCTDPTYQFNGCSEFYNHSKRFAYNKGVESKLLDLFQEFDVSYDHQAINSNQIKSLLKRCDNPGSKAWHERQQYRDCMEESRIRITQQTRLSLTDDSIKKGICKMYPQLLEMLQTIDADNETMDPCDYDHAMLNLQRGRGGICTKISMRKTNRYCNLKVHNISMGSLSDDEKRRTRNGVIIDRLGAVNENDVCSSIYRVTCLLNHGVWLDQQHDLYQMMAGFALPKGSSDRDLFKAPFAMKIYFSPSIDKIIANSSFRRHQTKARFQEWNAKALLTEARKRMFDVIGSSYRSEIFLHESCIYTQVAHQIRSLGYKLIQIYDGFFTDRCLEKEMFEEIVKDCALGYYRKYKEFCYPWES